MAASAKSWLASEGLTQFPLLLRYDRDEVVYKARVFRNDDDEDEDHSDNITNESLVQETPDESVSCPDAGGDVATITSGEKVSPNSPSAQEDSKQFELIELFSSAETEDGDGFVVTDESSNEPQPGSLVVRPMDFIDWDELHKLVAESDTRRNHWHFPLGVQDYLTRRINDRGDQPMIRIFEHVGAQSSVHLNIEEVMKLGVFDESALMAAVEKWKIPAYRICRVVEIVLEYVSRLTPTEPQTPEMASDSSSYQPSVQSQDSTLSEYLPMKDMKQQRQSTPMVKQTTTNMITVNSNNPAQALKKGRSSRALTQTNGISFKRNGQNSRWKISQGCQWTHMCGWLSSEITRNHLCGVWCGTHIQSLLWKRLRQ